MEPRRKPTPNPIARAEGPSRLLAPARTGSRLPTVAALLSAAASLALMGCEVHEHETITGEQAIQQTLPARVSAPGEPRPYEPWEPLPGMGALEASPIPQPEPTVAPPPVKPPSKPYPVKGGAKSVHPTPIPPMAAGGLKPAAPIPPPSKPPKLSGDVAMVMPETT